MHDYLKHCYKELLIPLRIKCTITQQAETNLQSYFGLSLGGSKATRSKDFNQREGYGDGFVCSPTKSTNSQLHLGDDALDRWNTD